MDARTIETRDETLKTDAQTVKIYEDFLEEAKTSSSVRTSEELVRVKKLIDEYDYSFVEEKLMKHIKFFGSCFDKEDIERTRPQFKAFLYNMYKYPDDEAIPNAEVDHWWHQFLMHMQEYEEFCIKVYGKIIYHVPFHAKTAISQSA